MVDADKRGLMAQMSPRQQEVVRAVAENPGPSEVEENVGITARQCRVQRPPNPAAS
jgi:hypothetical protein